MFNLFRIRFRTILQLVLGNPMSKITPVEAEPEAVAFTKGAVATTPPMAAFDPAYVARKKAVGESILTLASGRQLAYFTEGNPADPAVLCLHSLGQSKLEWLFPNPLPGVFLIAVDRQGHGSSSPYPPGNPLTMPRKFSDDLHEFVELLDSLSVDKFYVTGSSMGGSWAIAIAAALPDRVLACAPISAMADPRHPSVAKEEKGRICGDAGTLSLSIGEPGCAGGFLRSMINPYFKVKDTSKDPGFRSHYVSYFKYGDAKGKKHGPFDKMDSNHFFVSATLDAFHHGVNCKHCAVLELVRIFGKQGWGCDAATVQCPTFIYHGKKDAETHVACAEFHHRVIKGSELIMMPEIGHVTILLKAEEIILALVQKKAISV